MDLLGRKLVMEDGKALQLLKREVSDAVEAAKAIDISETSLVYPPAQMAEALEMAMARLKKTTLALGSVAKEKGPEAFLADATLFLEMFGITVIAWQWLTMATAAAKGLSGGKPKKKEKTFLAGKLATAQYFFIYELPKTLSLAVALETSSQITCALTDDFFTDKQG